MDAERNMQIVTSTCVKCGRQFDYSFPIFRSRPKHPRKLCQLCRAPRKNIKGSRNARRAASDTQA